jgi:hypothetical protein
MIGPVTQSASVPLRTSGDILEAGVLSVPYSHAALTLKRVLTRDSRATTCMDVSKIGLVVAQKMIAFKKPRRA